MYEMITIEKNKSSCFGVHFYPDASQWNVFLDVCGFTSNKYAVICSEDIQNEAWCGWRDSFTQEDIFKLTEKDLENPSGLEFFIADKKKDHIFIILNDSRVMEVLYHILTAEDSKIAMIMVPVTSYALFQGISIRPVVNQVGDVIRKELLPKAVYVDVSLLNEAPPLQFQDGIASAFKLAISYKASMFEWMISNMYELTDNDEEAISELLQRGFHVWKERIEKDSAKERSIGIYGEDFSKLFKCANKELSEADLTSLSLVCQSYLSWKKELLSMEEFYEIRDMLVFFGLSITETFATAEELLAIMEKTDLSLCKGEECIYIRKLGKLMVETAPAKEMIKEALEQIYFDEDANE